MVCGDPCTNQEPGQVVYGDPCTNQEPGARETRMVTIPKRTITDFAVLQALGIEAWVPRQMTDEAQLVTATTDPNPAQTLSNAAPARKFETTRNAVPPDTGNAQQTATARHPARKLPPSPDAPQIAIDVQPMGNLLWITDQRTPMPGWPGFLRDIARAIRPPDETPPAPMKFRWPLPLGKGTDQSEPVAIQALAERLHGKTPECSLICCGEDAARWIDRCAPPSRGVIRLAEPQKLVRDGPTKRKLWQILEKLTRSPETDQTAGP